MKRLFFCFSLSAILIGCASKSDHLQRKVNVANKDLFVAVVDFSWSTNHEIKYIDSPTARKIYMCIADGGGGTIKAIGIYSNSLEQDILSIDVPSLDTIESSSIPNVYIRNRKRKENENLRESFEQQTEEQISQFIAFINRPHDCKYSDVANSLRLAKIVCDQGNFKEYRKIVGLFSDLKNQPPHKGKSALIPIELEQTTVVCIRPAMSHEKLQELFPSSTVEVITTANDIIQLLNLNKTSNYVHK